MILVRDILIEKSDSKTRSIRPNSIFIECLEDDSYYCCFKEWSGIERELAYGLLSTSNHLVFKDIEFISFEKRTLNDSIFIRKFMDKHLENQFHFTKNNWRFSIIDKDRNVVQRGILKGVIFTSLSLENIRVIENFENNTFTVTARFDTYSFGQRN